MRPTERLGTLRSTSGGFEELGLAGELELPPPPPPPPARVVVEGEDVPVEDPDAEEPPAEVVGELEAGAVALVAAAVLVAAALEAVSVCAVASPTSNRRKLKTSERFAKFLIVADQVIRESVEKAGKSE
jgi:hypothetical protein